MFAENGGNAVGYRDRPDFWGESLKAQDPKSYRWALVALVIPNLVNVVAMLAKDQGWPISSAIMKWVVLVVGLSCIVAGFVAYRASRSQVRKDLAEMMPANLRD